MTRNGFDTCSEDACYFGNCTTDAAFRTEWDGAPGVSAGDPTLDDDTFGLGPELLTVPSPIPETFHIGV